MVHCNTINTESCDTILIEINDLYRKMAGCLKLMAKSPQNVTNKNHPGSMDTFNSIQANIRKQEAILSKVLPQLEPYEKKTLRLLSERKNLISEVLDLNKKVRTKAGAIKSALVEELKNTKRGHIALQGYGSINSSRIHGSFSKSF